MKCNDCMSEHDDRFTMDFTDVEPDAYIYWCVKCGPEAHATNDLLMKLLDDPGFVDEFVKVCAASAREQKH